MIHVWFCRAFSCLIMIGAFSCAAARAEEPVTIESNPDGLVVKIQGEEFTVFHNDPSQAKPYFWPVKAADGTILTRPIDPNEKDHPHHRGMWLSVDEVNDIRFWAERGKIVNREVKSSSGNPAKIHLRNEWLKSEGVPTLLEQTTISIYPNRLITYETTLTRPTNQLVRFDDTKEGFLGFRIAQSMREKEGGTVINSEGQKTTAECWGRPARWVDYTGNVNGKTYGVAIMDHPANFRPSRYHVRDYGLFSVSPFGEGAYQNDKGKAKPVILDDVTASLRFRYGLYIHSGPVADAKVPEAYNQFLQSTK
ncbi:DUF6807 domain-containing protein [Schlesneria paludicola]|uniref:DUF6807 domain-containing protein n=1 Tax=Schlesneria paludicola TaxID=360056 RepID=UPI00029B182E|nr:PmoA family protein [Schlesneria paludicola]